MQQVFKVTTKTLLKCMGHRNTVKMVCLPSKLRCNSIIKFLFFNINIDAFAFCRHVFNIEDLFFMYTKSQIQTATDTFFLNLQHLVSTFARAMCITNRYVVGQQINPTL